MGSFTDYLENKILEHIVGKTSFTMPTNVYIALSTTTPTDAGGNVTEPAGNNYSRKQTTASDWATASGGSINNAAELTFATPSGSWGTVTHFVIYDAASSGNALIWGALSSSKTIGNGDPVKFAIGQLTITQD